MARVLVVYELAKLVRKRGEVGVQSSQSSEAPRTVFVAHDEKPGIQSIGGLAPGFPPQPRKRPSTGCEYEHQRLGTLALMAG